MLSTRRLVLLFAAAVTMLAAQPRTVVFEFEPVMVDTGVTKIITSLLRDRMTDSRAFAVVQPPAGVGILPVEAAESLARSLGAEKLVVGNVTRVGMKYMVSYKLLTASTGAIELSDRTSVESENDFDILTMRIAASLRAGKSYQTSLELGAVGEQEGAAPRAREPLSSVLFTTGYTFPISHKLPYDPGSMLFTLDAAVTYETPNYLASGQMGVMRGLNGFTDVHFEMLGHKLFSSKDVAPFVGAGLGVHRIWFRPDYPLAARNIDGLSLIANGGVLLFRTYYFRAIADARASVLFTGTAGPVTSAGLGFGLTSPGFGPEGTLKTPPACIYGTLTAFFITGLIVALVN
jgi:hypothetical protein